MYYEVGSDTIYSVLDGSFKCLFGGACHPIRTISLGLVAWSGGLAAFATFAIYLSTKFLILRVSHLLSITMTVLISAIIAVIYRYVAAFFMPIVWLTVFNDYMLGLPASYYAYKASWLLYPSTFLLATIAVSKIGFMERRKQVLF
jgi:hypothetical protein